MQLPRRWKRHYDLALAAVVEWGVGVGVAKILTKNTRRPYLREAQQMNPNKAASRDEFFAKTCPQFARQQAECKKHDQPVTDEMRENALVWVDVHPGRICDWLAPGIPVNAPAAGAVGGLARRALRRTYEGETKQGVTWRDRYPLAKNAGKQRITDKNGDSVDVWMAVRVVIGPPVTFYRLTSSVMFWSGLTHANVCVDAQCQVSPEMDMCCSPHIVFGVNRGRPWKGEDAPSVHQGDDVQITHSTIPAPHVGRDLDFERERQIRQAAEDVKVKTEHDADATTDEDSEVAPPPPPPTSPPRPCTRALQPVYIGWRVVNYRLTCSRSHSTGNCYRLTHV